MSKMLKRKFMMIRLHFIMKIIFFSFIFFFYGCTKCSKSGQRVIENKRLENSHNKSYKFADLESSKTESISCRLKEGRFYPVKKEVDGDTFWLEDGCDGVKIRLIGINAPESKNAFGHIKEQPFGKEANEFMSILLAEKLVRIEFDVDTLDPFKRTLAYCFTDDGIFLNKKMVEEGFAVIETVQPNIKYQDVFYESQVKARNMKKGIWK